MLEKFLNSLRQYAENHGGTTWLENHLLYFVILGTTIVVLLTIIFVIKINEDIKKEKSKLRKKEKELLKSLSEKKNKTF